MSRVFHIGLSDLRLFLRDKSAYIWLLGMPLAFAFFMGFAMRDSGGDPANARPRMLIVNHDSGFAGKLFLETLDQQGLNTVSEANAEDATRGLTLPENFTDQLLSKERTLFDFFKIDVKDDEQSILAQVILFRAIVAFNGYLVEFAMDNGSDATITEEGLRRVMEKPDPVVVEASFAGRNPIPVGYNLSLPGNLVMYLLINLMIFGGAGIASERRSGVLRRLSINPISRSQLLAGKLFGLILLGLVQITVFLFLGQFAFGLNIGENLFGIVLTLIAFSWVGASAGLLVGFLIKAEEKIIGLSLLLGLPMAALGGCWWPLEVVPERMQKLAFYFPTGWALDALHRLITFGDGIEAIWSHIGVLALFGLAINAVAVRAFRV